MPSRPSRSSPMGSWWQPAQNSTQGRLSRTSLWPVAPPMATQAGGGRNSDRPAAVRHPSHSNPGALCGQRRRSLFAARSRIKGDNSLESAEMDRQSHPCVLRNPKLGTGSAASPGRLVVAGVRVYPSFWAREPDGAAPAPDAAARTPRHFPLHTLSHMAVLGKRRSSAEAASVPR